MKRNVKYESGHMFGKIMFLSDVTLGRGRKARFKCHCGEEFITTMSSVKTGNTKSCGCLKLENTIEAKRNHWEGKTYEKLRNDMQLRIYHYAAHHLFPQYENILVTINYINDGGPFTVFFSRSDIDVTLENIRKKYEAIRDIEIPKLTKSWKCTKLCFAGKSTFEDTNVLPLIEKRAGQRTPQGQIMTKCEQCKYVNQHRNIGAMMKNMSAPNYDINAYKDPGSI